MWAYEKKLSYLSCTYNPYLKKPKLILKIQMPNMLQFHTL